MIKLFISLIIYTIGLITEVASSDTLSNSIQIQGTVSVEQKLISKSKSRNTENLLANIDPTTGWIEKGSFEGFPSKYVSLQQRPAYFVKNNNENRD